MVLSAEAIACIAEEERVLREVLLSLSSQLTTGIATLKCNTSAARNLTADLVNARRDEDRQLIASDESVAHSLTEIRSSKLPLLKKLLSRPYFARIVLEESGAGDKRQFIEFKLGLAANIECRIGDWRKAPLARLYYEYRQGEEYSEVIQGRERNGRVLLRNRVEIQDGELRLLQCSLGNFEKVRGVWMEAATKRRHRGQGLPDVLALITPEQFRAITEEAKSAVLIRGVAGSGKTTVALYRLAWLLHPENSDVRTEDCVIVVKSNVLRSYVEYSLRAFGLTGVEVVTYEVWARRSVQGLAEFADWQCEENAFPRRMKHSSALVYALEDYAKEERTRCRQRLREGLGQTDEALGARVERGLDKGRPIVPLLMEAEEVAHGEARDAVREERERFSRYGEALLTLLKRHDLILPHDETSLIDGKTLNEARSVTAASLARNVLDPDHFALLLRLFELRNGVVGRAHGEPRPYAHIVIDELQDYTAAELVSLLGAARTLSDLTLVGDEAQGMEIPFPVWEKLRPLWGDRLSSYISLEVSQRSTLPIMRFADAVRGERRTTKGRTGSAPLWYQCRSENRGVREAIGWLTRLLERYPESVVAVLCRDLKECRFASSLLKPAFEQLVRLACEEGFDCSEGILISTVEDVKGLEFPHVLLWNPSARTYPEDDRSRAALYIAATRAEERLCLVTWSRPSPYLERIHPPLVRIVEEEEEEIDKEITAEEGD